MKKNHKTDWATVGKHMRQKRTKIRITHTDDKRQSKKQTNCKGYTIKHSWDKIEGDVT